MSEKTYRPTSKRLRDARKQGEVAKSRELTSLGAFLAVLLGLWLGAERFGKHLMSIIERALAATSVHGQPASLGLPEAQKMLSDALWIVVPLLTASVACALLIGGLQTRGMFSVTPITPKFDRLNPAQGLRNLFSIRQLFELGKMLIKMTLLLSVLAYAVALSLDPLAKMVYAPPADLLRISATLAWRVMALAAGVYAIGAALDYAHQFYDFMKRHRMSLEELRREHREEEGNPQIRWRRRAIARDMAFEKVIHRLSSASVVVVNPTHVSVALYYAPGETDLPRVVAKGVDALALHIRTTAERNGVPVLEDPPLARQLFRGVALDHYITADLIDATAAAFRWAKQVDRRSIQSGSHSPRQNPTPRTV